MSAEEARAEAERRYGLMGGDTHGPSLHAFIAGAEWQASREVTEAKVEAAAKAAWVAHNGNDEWARSVVDDVFSPADDWSEEALDMACVARAALEAAREVRS